MDENPGVRTFRFSAPADFDFKPGMSVSISFEPDSCEERPFSIASSPLERGTLEITAARRPGAYYDRLFGLAPGGRLLARGPAGGCVYEDDIPHAALVSAGTGAAPHRSMARYVLGKLLSNRLTLFSCAPSASRLLYRRELSEYRLRGIEVHERVTRPDPGWDGPVGRWTAAHLDCALGGLGGAVFFLCGPASMVKDLAAGLRRRGVPAERIRAEPWALRSC